MLYNHFGYKNKLKKKIYFKNNYILQKVPSYLFTLKFTQKNLFFIFSDKINGKTLFCKHFNFFKPLYYTKKHRFFFENLAYCFNLVNFYINQFILQNNLKPGKIFYSLKGFRLRLRQIFYHLKKITFFFYKKNFKIMSFKHRLSLPHNGCKYSNRNLKCKKMRFLHKKYLKNTSRLQQKIYKNLKEETKLVYLSKKTNIKKQ